MKKGAELLAMLRNETNDKVSGMSEKDEIKSEENQINSSHNICHITDSNIILQQSPENNFIKLIQKEANTSSFIMNTDNQNTLNNSTHNNFTSPKKGEEDFLDNEDDYKLSSKDQIPSQSLSPQQKRLNYGTQTRSKSLFFKENTNQQGQRYKKRSEQNLSSEQKNQQDEHDNYYNQTNDDNCNDKDDKKQNNNDNNNIFNNNDNNNIFNNNNNDIRKQTITDNMINKVYPSESLLSSKSHQERHSSKRPLVQTKESKMYSSTSSTSIQQPTMQGESASAIKNKSYFTFGKSEKLIGESMNRFDFRKKSFIFTNFLKHADDSESEDKSQSATHPNTKATPLHLIHNGTLNLIEPSSNNTNQFLKAKKPKKQGWNFAIQLKNINRFISKMRDQTSESNYSKLLPHHLNLINDKSYQSEGGSSQFFSKYESVENRNCLSKIPIFEPDDTLLITYKVFIILVLIVEIFILPIELGFLIDIYGESSQINIVFRIIPIFLFVIDFLCRMNTGYYQNGTFVEKRKEIIRQFRTILILDLINIITLIFRISFSTPFLFLIFAVRVILMYYKCQDVSDNFSLLERYPSVYNLTKLAFILLVVGHVCGCGFHFITTIDAGEYSTPSWIKFYNYDQLNIQNRYLLSIYYSTITMITVGYGDITPQNQIERIYVICIVIISGTVFAYAVNMIGAIFQEKEKKIADYKQMKFDISNYMMNRQISKKTQLKVYNYLDYINKKENESPEKGQKILSLISENLKNEVYKEFYGKIMTNSRLFHNKFSKEFIQKVSLRMEEKMYAPGEIVFLEGSQDNQCLYYILKGKVEMFTNRGDKKHFLGHLKEGDSMGHRCFTASQPNEWSIVTAEVTHLVYISQINFLDCLKEYPLDQEVFMLAKDEIIFGQNRFMNPCYSCGKQTHMVIDCPLIHYQKNKQLFINRHLYSVPEKDRKKIERQLFHKKNSLNILKKVKSSLKVIRTALEYSYFQNTQIKGSQIVLNDKESDRQFFCKMAKFKFNEENNLVIDSQQSEGDDSNDTDTIDIDGEDDQDEEEYSQNTERPNEIAELQDEEENTESYASPILKKRNRNQKKNLKFQSSFSIKNIENEEGPVVQQNQVIPLYKKTLTNNSRYKQSLNYSFSNSMELDRLEDLNSSFANRIPSILDTNSQQNQSDLSSFKRSATIKGDNLQQLLLNKKVESSSSQTTQQGQTVLPQLPKKHNKKLERFKQNLQPIHLYTNFDEVMKNIRLDETFSPYQIALDEKNYHKVVQDTNNQLHDHLNNSIHRITKQNSFIGKKKNPEVNRVSTFKGYQQNNTQSSHNLNTPLYQPHYDLLKQPFILSNQNSSNRQNAKLSINSPSLIMLKRDPLLQNHSILNTYAATSKKQNQEMVIVGKQEQNNQAENAFKYPVYNSNTQLPFLDSQPYQMNEVTTPTGLFNQQNLQYFNQNLLQNINLNQLNINNPHHYQIIQYLKSKEEFSIPNFETMRDYTIYFPLYNCSSVLKKIQRKSAPLKKRRITLQSNPKGSRVRRNSSLKITTSFPMLSTQ